MHLSLGQIPKVRTANAEGIANHVFTITQGFRATDCCVTLNPTIQFTSSSGVMLIPGNCPTIIQDFLEVLWIGTKLQIKLENFHSIIK